MRPEEEYGYRPFVTTWIVIMGIVLLATVAVSSGALRPSSAYVINRSVRPTRSPRPRPVASATPRIDPRERDAGHTRLLRGPWVDLVAKHAARGLRPEERAQPLATWYFGERRFQLCTPAAGPDGVTRLVEGSWLVRNERVLMTVETSNHPSYPVGEASSAIERTVARLDRSRLVVHDANGRIVSWSRADDDRVHPISDLRRRIGRNGPATPGALESEIARLRREGRIVVDF